uniref:Regulatory protein zeste n=1 Tax=Diabrotica virgifera virgifera TaxID=50390 RepID=A0A6P7G1L3_DIAVI
MSFKLTEGHWNILLEFMEHHKEFAKGQFHGPTGKTIQRKLWEELSQLLNSLGEGIKPVEKWQKTWADIKYTIKKKAAAKRQDIAATGGGPKIKVELNEMEERVVHILGKTFYEGTGVSECGIASTSNIQTPEVPSRSIETTDHGYCKSQASKKKNIQDVENDIMQNSLTELREIKLELRNLNLSMSSIADSLAELVTKK